MIPESTLLYDIETATAGNRPNPEKDKLRAFGCYSYKSKKYYFLTDPERIRKIIRAHKYLVGFNTKGYDNRVLRYNGFCEDTREIGEYKDTIFNYKFNIDLYQVFKKRAPIMMINKDGEKILLKDALLRYSLDYISKTLGIVDEDDGKMSDFDYEVLKKSAWTPEELQKIKDYTHRDIEVTKKLFEWTMKYFDTFKEFVEEKDIKNLSYITCAPSVFGYKAVCKEMGWEEEYNDGGKRPHYGGGYVAYPAGEHFYKEEGDLYLVDFTSEYPHAFIMCNLYSPANFGWNGGGKFKVDGTYNDKEQGKIEKLIKTLLLKKIEYKKNKDPREYTIKIIINLLYGISAHPAFKHLFQPTSSSDCTGLGRQWVWLVRKRFRENGYINIFSDTDSVCVLDPFRDYERLKKVIDSITKEILDSVPFPSPETFKLDFEAKISDIWFWKNKKKAKKRIVIKTLLFLEAINIGDSWKIFQPDEDVDDFMDEDDYINKPKDFMKKNYLYLGMKDDGERYMVVKNLGVRKKSTSTITRNIFWEILKPRIIKERKVRFSRQFFEKTIQRLLKEDINLATKRYEVRETDDYASKTSIQYQISERYGAGIHFLISNDKIGVGKAKKYCTLKEFNEAGMTLSDINLVNVWKELKYFIDQSLSVISIDISLTEASRILPLPHKYLKTEFLS